LQTHKVIDEIERLEIEHYLNQGPNPLLAGGDSMGAADRSDHPRHRIDP